MKRPIRKKGMPNIKRTPPPLVLEIVPALNCGSMIEFLNEANRFTHF